MKCFFLPQNQPVIIPYYLIDIFVCSSYTFANQKKKYLKVKEEKADEHYYLHSGT